MDREELLKLSKEELVDVVSVQEQKINTLVRKNAELEARLTELEALLNMNSKNSSKPPSSDDFKK